MCIRPSPDASGHWSTAVADGALAVPSGHDGLCKCGPSFAGMLLLLRNDTACLCCNSGRNGPRSAAGDTTGTAVGGCVAAAACPTSAEGFTGCPAGGVADVGVASSTAFEGSSACAAAAIVCVGVAAEDCVAVVGKTSCTASLMRRIESALNFLPLSLKFW